MPYKCCVPKCQGNYDEGSKVQVFSFPKDENQRQRWLRAIPRQDYEVTTGSVVCALHFHDSFIVRKSIYRDPRNGKTIETALPVPRLDPAAVPSIFKECPSYLSKPECTKAREEPQQRLERLESSQLAQAVADSLIAYTEETSKNQFQTLKELNACLKSVQVPEKWSVLHTASFIGCAVVFMFVGGGATPTLDASVGIEDSLDVTACHNKVRLTKIDARTKFQPKFRMSGAFWKS
ncbi:unnamed protein product [Ixodes pacificus]